MTVRFAEKDEQTRWNEHILANPDGGNVFQGYELAMQKILGGWTPRFIVAGKLAITVLEKTVPGLGRLWYTPKGPGVATLRQLDDLLPALREFAARQGVFAVKIEPELAQSKETAASLLKLGLAKVSHIQPNASTVLIDLSPTLDTVIANLNQKGRHAIRRAERDGVTATPVKTTDKNCHIMYDLLAATAAGSFRIRGYNYYKTFWQRYENAGLGQLFFAYAGGHIVAGAFAIAFGKKGTYKDGASVRERTTYGASHLLQWRIIRWMKDRDVTTYDLCGTPPSGEINNPAHSHHGIGRFKTSFNKHVTDYIGAYDIVIKPAQYKLWRKIGERAALRLHNLRHHENYY